MILISILCFIILLLIFLIVRSKENYVTCPNYYSPVCAQQSYESSSKGWCALSSADIPCTNKQDNYSQQQCLNSSSLTTRDSYETNDKAWCRQPKEEYYY